MRSGSWGELERPAPDAVPVGSARVRRGSRVVLRPRPGGDVMDVALAGRVAVVEAIEQDLEGAVKLAVVVEDDPGRDLGYARALGHRFFFDPTEVEVLGDAAPAPAPAARPARVLVAGIGNVFLGDDGFGVALAQQLASRPLPAGVEVRDFGIRGMDLAFAMQDGYDCVVMLDATPRGEPPGTLYVVEVDPTEGEAALEPHGMHPLAVIALVRAFGGVPPRTLVVGCEPQTRMSADDEEIVAELSAPVQAALEPGLALVESLLADLTEEPQAQEANDR